MIKRLFNKRKVQLTTEEKWVRDQYLSSFNSRIPSKKTLDQLNYVVLDTETSGLDIKKDKILSVAAVKIIKGSISISERMEYFIQETNYTPGKDIEVHGITRSKSMSGISMRTMMLEFLPFIENAIIVGHHISFDIKMLDRYVMEYFGIRLKNKTLDTARINHRLESGVNEPFKPVGLDELALKYQVPLGARHTAAGDTFISAIIFLKMLNRLEKRGVKTYRSLFR